jgi:hypothetical protein
LAIAQADLSYGRLDYSRACRRHKSIAFHASDDLTLYQHIAVLHGTVQRYASLRFCLDIPTAAHSHGCGALEAHNQAHDQQPGDAKNG